VNFLPSFVANPNLKPEESAGWDVGFEQPVANNAIRFGSTYFRNDIRSLIATVDSTTPGVETLANINTASTFGFENFAAWQVSSRLNFAPTIPTRWRKPTPRTHVMNSSIPPVQGSNCCGGQRTKLL
jgi:outer membrane cobalamin receptor